MPNKLPTPEELWDPDEVRDAVYDALGEMMKNNKVLRAQLTSQWVKDGHLVERKIKHDHLGTATEIDEEKFLALCWILRDHIIF